MSTPLKRITDYGRRTSLHPLALPWVNTERGGLPQAAQGMLLPQVRDKVQRDGLWFQQDGATVHTMAAVAPVADREFRIARYQPPHRATMATTES